VIRWLWVVAAVVSLTLAFRGYDGSPNSDADEFLAWAMLALGFPSSLLWSACFAVVAYVLASQFQVTIHTSYASMAISWAVPFVLGYVQWFVFLPWLVQKLRARRRSHGTDSTEPSPPSVSL
jgi:hypothetical protein